MSRQPESWKNIFTHQRQNHSLPPPLPLPALRKQWLLYVGVRRTWIPIKLNYFRHCAKLCLCNAQLCKCALCVPFGLVFCTHSNFIWGRTEIFAFEHFTSSLMTVPLVHGKVFLLTKPLRVNATKSIKLILKLITRPQSNRTLLNVHCSFSLYPDRTEQGTTM